MVPLVEVSEENLRKLSHLKIPYALKENPHQIDGFIYVPSLNLYFSKRKVHLEEDWFNCHKLLQKDGCQMSLIPEFLEFLRYLRSQPNNKEYQSIYKEITRVRDPKRSEWLDAGFEFKVKDKRLYINYNHVLGPNGRLVPKNSEILDENTLMEDRCPAISLADYLNKSHTIQGLPDKMINSRDSKSLYYFYPRVCRHLKGYNNSAAVFSANFDFTSLSCCIDPSYKGSALGVRAVRKATGICDLIR